MFIWIDYGKYITAMNKKCILYLENTDDFRYSFENNNSLWIFIDILWIK